MFCVLYKKTYSYDRNNYKESSLFLKKCVSCKYVVPKNVINNVTQHFSYSFTELSYDDLQKKYIQILNNMMNYYINNHLNESVHIASIYTKNRQTITYNNKDRTYCFNNHFTSLHAEHSCILQGRKLYGHESLLKKKTLLCVIKYDKNGNICNSTPCNHCLCIIKKHNINTIMYSAGNGKYHVCKLDK